MISNGEFVMSWRRSMSRFKHFIDQRLLANLEIVEDIPYGLAVSHIPLSRDTVSWAQNSILKILQIIISI